MFGSRPGHVPDNVLNRSLIEATAGSSSQEAHGYMLENQVLTEAFGDDNANSLMERQLPQWNGIDQPPWSRS